MTTEQISVRIDHATKVAAEKVFSKLGLSATDAVRMFYKRVIQHRGIPFDVRVPNAETLTAFKQLDEGKGKKYTLKEFQTYLESL